MKVKKSPFTTVLVSCFFATGSWSMLSARSLVPDTEQANDKTKVDVSHGNRCRKGIYARIVSQGAS
jgi:hypothetical protein